MNFKRIISFRFKFQILLFLMKFKKLSYFKDFKLDDKKKVYVFLAADYGNLGDVAITYAQTEFLKQNLPDWQIVEIPISKSLEGLHFVNKLIRNDDLVTTIGGGNLGDMYDQIEFIRQLVVRYFPNNKIISFPQTFDFSDTSSGQKALAKAKKVYNKHKNLTFAAREKRSFRLMQKHFSKVKVIQTPDIVLSLDKSKPEKERKGAIICLRNDKEKKLTKEQTIFISEWAKLNFSSVSDYDTHVDKNEMSISERMDELNKIWNAFKSAELVITDRLHGMIFCQITRTPCLVFLNNNHKIKETYEWIRDNEDIRIVNEFSDSWKIDSIKKTPNNLTLKKAFYSLINILQ